ncbi:prepilin-type N-terminal cleavage/methylation domain-containing protein [Acinetobacter sp. CWB-B33]|jgi:type IV pilus assembly protein PilE|uniref:type IV pilin protein n=1 Tax=Acinetobacter sp. CWB-B33 TaxID=2815724 RepID=UPI0031FECE9A
MNLSSAKKINQGFTLIEMMVAVVIVAIFAAIAIPSYQQYARRSAASEAEQEIQRLAVLLERHKARNFNYKGFSTVTATVAPDSTYPYTVSIVDDSTGNPLLTSGSAVGQGWAIQALTADPQNYSFLLTSTGIRCKNKTNSLVSFSTCDSEANGAETW